MYYLEFCVMANSSVSRSCSWGTISFPQNVLRRILGKKLFSNFTFVLPFTLIFFAICLAPEQPEQMASICQKHNPVVACQVW